MALQYVQQRPSVCHVSARVISAESGREGFALLTLDAPAIALTARPGQFVSVACPTDERPLRVFDSAEEWAAGYRKAPARAPGSPPLLRRPISIHSVSAQGELSLLFKLIGRGTRQLAALRPGDAVDVLGPMGNGFDLAGAYETAVLVAGGAGLAPMPLLAERLAQMGKALVLIAGAKDEFPMPMECFLNLGAEALLASETPRPGVHHGLCTELLEGLLAGRGARSLRVFACGPWPMLRRVAELCAGGEVPLQVSLEQRMGCALGACMACVRRVLEGQQPHSVRVCTEGPVFDGRKVKWDERG